MKAILVISAVNLALATCSSWARLGETEEQCEKRYGKPSAPGDLISVRHFEVEPSQDTDKTLRYSKDGVRVLVSFAGGKAVSMQYHFEREAPLSRGEIEALLKLNAPECRWHYNFEHPFVLSGDPPEELGEDSGILWSTDGKYYAAFGRRTPMFAIMEATLRPVLRLDQPIPSSLEGF